MYKDILKYNPFFNEDAEFKDSVVKYARALPGDDTPNKFTKVLIYVNLVDYLARDLLLHFQKMTTISSYENFSGVFFMDNEKQKLEKLALGQLISELKRYEFPDKLSFVDLLENFNTERKLFVHKLMEMNPKTSSKKTSERCEDVYSMAEEIYSKYSTIAKALETTWKARKTS